MQECTKGHPPGKIRMVNVHPRPCLRRKWLLQAGWFFSIMLISRLAIFVKFKLRYFLIDFKHSKTNHVPHFYRFTTLKFVIEILDQ